ncbi:ComF family protein [Maribellus mangrovi]|uniref:ComF family protein n=1 Tax=Maribellus mangrovi TaxID=3133146 RepID=UPI0030ECA4D0
MISLHQNISDFLELLFPTICVTCGERLITQEKYVCFKCWSDLPVTHFHLEPENKVAQLFWGRVNIENAASYFSYKKGSKYQQLIHYTKYKGLKELGYAAGRKYGYVLGDSEAFKIVDLVVPVPLHPKKHKKRGYNQCEWIAKGVAEGLKKEVSIGNLFRKTFTSTQTRKNRYERWQNVEGIFGINRPEEFANKHLLLIDDVVTTGSTLEACASETLKIPNTKVSIATLAFADI